MCTIPTRCIKCPSYWSNVKFCQRLGKLVTIKNFRIFIDKNGVCTDNQRTLEG